MVHIVVHAALNGVSDIIHGVAAQLCIAANLPNPLQIDDRHNADQQIRIL